VRRIQLDGSVDGVWHCAESSAGLLVVSQAVTATRHVVVGQQDDTLQHRVSIVGQQDDALQHRVSVVGLQYDALQHRVSIVGQQDDALQHRVSVVGLKYDTLQHRVSVVSSSGRVLKSCIGKPRLADRLLRGPFSLVVDSCGSILVADCFNSRLSRLVLLDGELKRLATVIVCPDEGRICGMISPRCVHVDEQNARLFVGVDMGRVFVASL